MGNVLKASPPQDRASLDTDSQTVSHGEPAPRSLGSRSRSLVLSGLLARPWPEGSGIRQETQWSTLPRGLPPAPETPLCTPVLSGWRGARSSVPGLNVVKKVMWPRAWPQHKAGPTPARVSGGTGVHDTPHPIGQEMGPREPLPARSWAQDWWPPFSGEPCRGRSSSLRLPLHPEACAVRLWQHH